MALHNSTSIGIVIENTNYNEPESSLSNTYITSPTEHIHENMIITNADVISGVTSIGVRAKRRLPVSIPGGLGSDKQQERENSINSKNNKKSKMLLISMHRGRGMERYTLFHEQK